ncbi:MAG: IclR family transcriptional regulator [Mycobacteriaceae bacterium]
MGTSQLLNKATLLIDYLARAGAGTPAEIAKEIGEPRPSVYRLTAALSDAGYVRSASDGQLELGPVLLRLGDAAISAVVDRQALRAVLQRVGEQLGMGAFFGVLRGDQVICLDQVDGTDVDLLYLVPGKPLPSSGGAASDVLLENGHMSGDGYSYDDGRLGVGVATMAVPVVTGDGDVVGTVAVAGLSGNVAARRETSQEVLESAAREISRIVPGDLPAREHGSRDGGSPVVERSSSVVAKASALMQRLASRGTATSAQLSSDLGEPVSSVYRMLGTLIEVGWVEHAGARGGFRVGLTMLSLAEKLLRRLDIRRVAAPIMSDIHAATGETTFLCIRHGGRAVCIERLDGIRVNSRVLQLGKSLPLHMGAAPRALLAFGGKRGWEDYAAGIDGSGESWQGVGSRAELFSSLEDACAKGYVLSDNDVTSGIAAVGVPVFDHRGDVVASLSVSGLREGIMAEGGHGDSDNDEGSVVSLVREGGRRLSGALGALVAP